MPETQATPKRVKDRLKLGVRARAAGEAVKKFAGKHKAALIASGIGLAGAGAAGALGYKMGKKSEQNPD